MDQFEILGSSGETPDAEPADDGPSKSSTTSLWLLVAPVVVVVGLLAVLSRGEPLRDADKLGSASTLPSSDVVPTSTIRSLPTLTTQPDELGPAEEAALLASFDHQVMIGETTAGDIHVQRLSDTESHSIGLSGTPMAVVGDWLVFTVYTDEPRSVWAVDLSDATSEPVQLGTGSDDVWWADTVGDLLFLGGSVLGHQTPRVMVFDVGSWSEPAWLVDSVHVAGWRYEGFAYLTVSGSGVFELGPDGYKRRGPGRVVSYSDQAILVEECTVDPLVCQIVVRDRLSWDLLVVLDRETGSDTQEQKLAPDDLVLLEFRINDGGAASLVLVDLVTGAETTVMTDGWESGQQIGGVTTSAVLLHSPWNTRVDVVDRQSGQVVSRFVPQGFPVAADLARVAVLYE